MKTLRIFLLALIALVAGGVAPARAQPPVDPPRLLYTLETPNPESGAWFGYSVALGDVNGDGLADVAVGSVKEDVGGRADEGRAYVYSGADGSVLHTLTTPNPEAGAWFGFSVAVGDANGDGKGDIAVGSPYEDAGVYSDKGRAYVFSGADGSLLHTLSTAAGFSNIYFGNAVAMGDVNGDGKADIAVGGYGRDLAYVFSGADGSVIHDLVNPGHPVNSFGNSVAVGDANGDGKADIAVGAHYENVGGNTTQGRAYVFSGANGSLLLTLDTPNPQSHVFFGQRVAMGDVGDGWVNDGCPAVDAPEPMCNNDLDDDLDGKVNDGCPPVFGSETGAQCDNDFDDDLDGFADIAVGAGGEDVGGNADQGRAYVFSGADGSLMLSLDTPNPQEAAWFGQGLAVGDVDGDGWVNDGCPPMGNLEIGDECLNRTDDETGGEALPEVGPMCDLADLMDDDGDGWVNDGCPAVGDPEDADTECDNLMSEDGDGYVNDGCPARGDGWVNDGCPPLGDPEAGPECANTIDDDGDGLPDIAVAASAEDVGGNQNEGRAYVFFRALPTWTVDSPNPQPEASFGWPLALGDVGDGWVNDGCPPVGDPEVDIECYNNADDDTDGTVNDGCPPVGDPEMGPECASNADDDRDGRADLAVGAHMESLPGPLGDNQGHAYVFLGGDREGDTVRDLDDNCLTGGNPLQLDMDADGVGAFCDNCPGPSPGMLDNPDQSDIDGDYAGDVCDPCPNDPTDSCDTNRSAGESIGSGGGSITTPDGSVDITIPAGALSEDTSISVTGDTASGFELTTDQGQGIGVFQVDIQPSGLQFAQPVTIVFAWDDVAPEDGRVDGTNIKERDLLIVKDGVALTARCQDVPAQCDQGANTFTFTVTGLSDFDLAAPQDTDGDDVPDNWGGVSDNCPTTYNPDQTDTNGDTIGDACAPVGGIAQLPDASDSSAPNYIPLAALAAAALLALTAGAWYARRRLS